MPNCTADEMNFGRLGRRVIEANFKGGAISSDGGLALLRQTSRRFAIAKTPYGLNSFLQFYRTALS